MSSQDILFESVAGVNGDIGLVTLNRNSALNALNLDMIGDLSETLTMWDRASSIKAVVIRSNHPKVFCAGGDIRYLYQQGLENNQQVTDFFAKEYWLNHLIKNYSKPYISLLNGITFGGGVGISLHGGYSIAGEKFRFAMPETSIGFFPDIGGSFILNQLPNNFGTYLALSGENVRRFDAYQQGLIKYCVDEEHFSALLNDLCDVDLSSQSEITVEKIIAKYHQEPIAESSAIDFNMIKDVFAHDNLAAICANLADNNDNWSQANLALLHSKSPLSLQVTFALLQQAQGKDLAAVLKLDFRLACRFMSSHDFYEGVRALIIEKDNQPKWEHSAINQVSESEISQYFAPLEQELLL